MDREIARAGIILGVGLTVQIVGGVIIAVDAGASGRSSWLVAFAIFGGYLASVVAACLVLPMVASIARLGYSDWPTTLLDIAAALAVAGAVPMLIGGCFGLLAAGIAIAVILMWTLDVDGIEMLVSITTTWFIYVIAGIMYTFIVVDHL